MKKEIIKVENFRENTFVCSIRLDQIPTSPSFPLILLQYLILNQRHKINRFAGVMEAVERPHTKHFPYFYVLIIVEISLNI